LRPPKLLNSFLPLCELDSFSLWVRKQIRKFLSVSYSDVHGKAIALDIRDCYAPFPSLFIIHEMRVRGLRPFQLVAPAIPDVILWQDWILLDGMLDYASFVNTCHNNSGSTQSLPQFHFLPTTTDAGDTSGEHALAPNENSLTSSRRPSWKAYRMEGTSWTRKKTYKNMSPLLAYQIVDF
jgi:hypothetical protein